MYELNEQQQKAVEHTSGPLLIIAGAGSGKTRVLTYRIYHLIKQNQTRPESILAVTFTNKAANEMKTRIIKMLGGTYALPWVGTFHSICVKILRHNAAFLNVSPQFTIYDTADQLEVLKDALKELGINEKAIRARAVLNYISNAKNELVTPEAYVNYAAGYFQEQVAKIYPVYQSKLESNSAVDFDDIIMKTVQLFDSHPEILKRYNDLFDYVLVDEYQDTNHAQYMLTRQLAGYKKNICVVGDDAQSIYSFRGATIQNILNFEEDYPDAKVIKLEQNYRSTQKILDASNAIIALNKNQKPKILWTENQSGEPITIYEALDEKDEARWIAQKINDIDSEDIAILYRTNAQSRALEEALLDFGISYKIVGSVEFYKRKEIKDVMAYLRVLLNPYDDLSLKRIINVPRRGIGHSTINSLEIASKNTGKTLLEYLETMDISQSLKLAKGVRNFQDVYKKIKAKSEALSVDELIEAVIEISGYRESLDDGTIEGESRLENIKELMTVARNFKDLPPRESLRQFIEELSLVEDHAADQNVEPKVRLMTVHSAKGLEFDFIFIAGMEENIFPHANSYLEINEMEEERRLAYVALTRARKKLYITHTTSRTFFGSRNNNPLSRFIMDIPEELREHVNWSDKSFNSEKIADNRDIQEREFDLQIGDKVRHEVFGMGVIEDFDDSVILVRFTEGRKELSKEYAKLTKL